MEESKAGLAQTSIQAAGPRSTGEPTLRRSKPDTRATYSLINNRETIINMARYQSILRLFLLVVLALIAISHGEESEGGAAAAVDVDDNAAEAAAEAAAAARAKAAEAAEAARAKAKEAVDTAAAEAAAAANAAKAKAAEAAGAAAAKAEEVASAAVDDAAAAFLERVNGTAIVLGEDDAIERVRNGPGLETRHSADLSCLGRARRPRCDDERLTVRGTQA